MCCLELLLNDYVYYEHSYYFLNPVTMSSALIIIVVGIVLFSAAFIVAIWQVVKYYRSRKATESVSSSSLEQGHRQSSILPQSPAHSGFQPPTSSAKTHLRNKSEPFKRDPKDKPLPSDPEDPARQLTYVQA